ncbi:MAG: hypothetical protein ABI886_09570 [Betaproteobacteria bacterium]
MATNRKALLFAGTGLLLNALVATVAAAFVPIIVTVQGQAVQGRIVVYIVDEIPGIPQGNATYAVSRDGSNITVCISHTYTPGTAPTEVTVPVDLGTGTLTLGNYQLNYLVANQAGGQPVPECSLRSSIPFPVLAAASVRETVEYYDAAQDHYFITADLNEIALLDSGHFPGWVRTGEKFYSYVPFGTPASTLAAVCRFYGRPEAGLDSHFFTDNVDECAYVQQHWSYAWQLETLSAFYVTPINPAISGCPPSTLPLFRLYNNKPDVNHRYTPDFAIRNLMVFKGWLYEGPVWCTINAQ